MSNAKEIKERMGSIQETKKITNAMYLISSSKMKQAKKKLSEFESQYATDLARFNQGSKGYFESIGASEISDFVFDKNIDNEALSHLASHTQMGRKTMRQA